MRIGARKLVVPILALLMAGPLRLHAQQSIPVAVTGAAVAPAAEAGSMFTILRRIATEERITPPRRSTDHVGAAPWRPVLIGAIVGGVTGMSAGYGLALLGHEAYCEGSVQCAERPTRAIRASTQAGLVLGAGVGAFIGWRVSVR
jgi:ElaB/YqjD/DUF883 family membrane-anchored ribosome-binding protein